MPVHVAGKVRKLSRNWVSFEFLFYFLFFRENRFITSGILMISALKSAWDFSFKIEKRIKAVQMHHLSQNISNFLLINYSSVSAILPLIVDCLFVDILYQVSICNSSFLIP